MIETLPQTEEAKQLEQWLTVAPPRYAHTNDYTAYTAKRLTFDLVFYAYEHKGYFFAKISKGYHCQTTDKKFPNLKSAVEYLETLPDRSKETMTTTATEVTEPVTESVAELVAERVTEPVAESIVEPVVKSGQESVTTPLTFTTIPTPRQFFNEVAKLETPLEVHQACNALMDMLAEKYTVATISKNLSSYKKLFYEFQHSNPQLNESVETKNGTRLQHIAGRLLTLSDEQKDALGVDRSERDNARAGFDKEGELREVEKPSVDITAIVKKSCELLSSNDPHTIGAGILNLTGLRQNEQNLPARNYTQHELLIQREMIAVGEHLIAFKGVSKKHNIDDMNAYYTRVTLAPAQLIVDAQKRYLSSKDVQSLPLSYEKYVDSGFNRTFRERYTQRFGTELSTIEAYDDEDNLVKPNGAPHKARAFYACAVRSILKAKGFTDAQASKYIQECLAHENQGITIKYLSRYDESDFINPIDINIPTNIKELGKMRTAIKPQTIEQLPEIKTEATTNEKAPKPKKAPKNSFDIDAFINGLNPDMQVKFGELMNSESSLTNAVLALINMSQAKNVDQPKKKSLADEIDLIVGAMMIYNREQSTPTNRIIPTYSLVNKISERVLNKAVAKKSFDNWYEINKEKLSEELFEMGIKGLDIASWNGKYHRKTMDIVLDSVITIMNVR